MGRQKFIDPEDWLVVNCAECGRELLGESMRFMKQHPDLPPFVAGRLNGRPYCPGCIHVRRPITGGRTTMEEDSGPWNQNAIRQMEDG